MAPDSRRNDTRQSLRHSTVEGAFSTLTTSFTQDYLAPFALVLGAGVRHIALLSALPNLVASLVQLKSADAADAVGSRTKIIGIFHALQALTIPFMFAAYFMGEMRVSAFIAAATLFAALGGFAAPAMGSLVADLVPPANRGAYFGRRNRLNGFIAIAAALTAGYILHSLEGVGVIAGFAVIFGLAFVFRAASWHRLRSIAEPAATSGGDDRFTLLEFLSRMKRSNFGRFVLYVSAVKFSVGVASPFFAVLMIRDLKFDYLTYTLVTLSMTLAANLSFRRWGLHSDRVGNLKVLKLSSRLVAFVPLLWLVNQNPYYLVFCQIVSGFAWAGFNLSATNFIYDAVSTGKRTRCISYFNALNGVSMGVGALFGGWIASVTEGTLMGGILNVVLVSGVMRLALVFVPINLKEVRGVEEIRSYKLFISMLKPAGFRAG